MIQVLKVNKHGNKILNYECTDGRRSRLLTKDQLSQLITQKKVANATQQIYNGTLIIRVKDAATAVTATPAKPVKPVAKPAAKTATKAPVKPVAKATVKQVAKPVVASASSDPAIADMKMKLQAAVNKGGQNITPIPMVGGDGYLINRGKGEFIFYIPDNVTATCNGDPEDYLSDGPNGIIRAVTGSIPESERKLVIVGGINLTRIDKLVSSLHTTMLNISKFEAQNAVIASHFMKMAHHSKIIGLNKLKLPKVQDAHDMFEYLVTESNLDLSNIEMNMCRNTSSMFRECKAKGLKLNFDARNVSDAHSMFQCSRINDILDISQLTFSNEVNMNGMLSGARSQFLNLGSIGNTNKLISDLSNIFSDYVNPLYNKGNSLGKALATEFTVFGRIKVPDTLSKEDICEIKAQLDKLMRSKHKPRVFNRRFDTNR